LEQTLRVDRLKDLAKIVNITEHGDELAHRDPPYRFRLRLVTQPPYAGPYAQLFSLSNSIR
jgi:hypothetical protein